MQRKNLKALVSVSNVKVNAKSSRRRKLLASALTAGIGLVGFGSVAVHADSAWNGTTGDFNSSNWSNGNPTTGVQNADVDNGGTVTISATSGTVNVNDIRAGDATAPTNAPSSGTWIQTGDTATVHGWFRLATNTSSSLGVYNLSGGTLVTTLYSNVGEAGTAVFNMSGTGVWNDTATGDDPIAIGGYGSGTVSGTGHGTLNMTGGTINLTAGTNEFWIGNGTGAVGVVNMSAGTLNCSSWLSVGRAQGNGTLNMSGGVINKGNSGTANSSHISLTGIGGTGVINLTGGTINTTADDLWVTENGPGTINISAGGVLNSLGVNLDNGGATGAVGILNLNGGTLSATYFFKGGTAGTGTVNFNGTQVISLASSTTYMTGLTAANVLAGGVNFNVSTYADTIAQPLLASTTSPGGGLTLTGTGTLTLSGANTFTGPINISSGTLAIGRTDTSTLAQNISGGGNFAMTGSGMVTISGSNSYAGTTSVTAGILYAPTPASLPNYLTTGKIIASTTGELALGLQAGGTGPGFALSDVNTLLTNGTFVTGGTTTTSPTLGLDTTNGSVTYPYNITGGIGFDKRGANTLTLTGTNSWTGRTTVTNGTLDLGANTTATGTTPIADPGVTIAPGANTATLIQSGGSVSSGIQEVYVANGGTGSVAFYNISGGTLTASNWIAVGRSAGSVGTINLSGTGVITKLTNNGNITLGSITGTGTLNQTGGTLNNLASNTYVGETGTGTYNMSGGFANLGPVYVDYNEGAAYTATLNLNAGTLSATTVQRNISTGTAVLNFNGGTLQANSSSAAFVSSTAGIFTTNVLAGGAKINTNGFNDTISTSLVGSAGDGGLTKLGAGILTVSGGNTYVGDTTVNGGTLTLGSTNSLPAGTSINNTASLNFNGQYSQPAGSSTPGLVLNNLNASSTSNFQFLLSSSGASFINFTGTANVSSGATITVNAPAGQTLAAGSYTLFSDTAGNLSPFVLSNSYVVSNGNQYPLSLNASTGADILTVGSAQAAKLYFTGNTSNDLSVASNFSTDAAGTMTATSVPQSFVDVVFTAGTANTANFTTTLGSTTAVNSLEFNNSYPANPVTVGGPGTLTLSANTNTFASGVGIVVDSGAGANTISANLNLPNSETFTNNSASPLTISGSIGGPSANTVVTINGTGTGAIVFSGSNSYTGSTVVSAGLLQLGGTAGSLGNAANFLTVSGTGTVDLNGAQVTQSSLNLAGGRVIGSLGTGVLTLTTTNATGPTILINASTGVGYANPVTTAATTGTIALTGATSSIVKPIGAGTPVLGSNFILGGATTIALSDTSGDAGGELSLTGAITGTGSLTLDNTFVVPGVVMANSYDYGTLSLSGTGSTYSGGTTIAHGRIVASSTSALGIGPITILQQAVGGGTLQLGNRAYTATSSPLAVGVITAITLPNAINFGGEISGNYSQGLVNDSGANTLTGTITLTNASEIIGVASGSLLMSGNIGESYTGAVLTKQGASPLTLSGTNNTWTGGLNITAGEVIGMSNHPFGTGTVTVTSGADANIGAGATVPNLIIDNGAGTFAGGVVGSATSIATEGNVTGTINLGTAGTNSRIGAGTGDFLLVTGPIVDGTMGVNLDVSGQGTLGNAASTFGTVTLEGSSTYTGITSVIRGNLIVDGTLLTPGQTNLNTTAAFNIAGSATVGDTATLTIQNGGAINTTGGVLVSFGGANFGSLTITSGSLTAVGNLQAASSNGSSATINISGGTTTVANFFVGSAPLGSTSTAIVNQTGGTINSDYFSMGFSGAGTTTANLSSGVLNVRSKASYTTGELEVGIFDTQAATLTIGAGETVNLDYGANFVVGSQNTSANNTVNQNGGSVTAYSDNGVTVGGTASLILGRTSGGNTAAGTETYNLNGGTLTVPSISRSSTSAATTAAGIFNFNGGTLVPAASSTTFLQGLTQANIMAGGANINANGKNITIAQVLSDPATGTPGVLTINDSVGTGNVTLTANSTFSGGAVLNAGTLTVANTTVLTDGSASPLGNNLTGLTINGGTLASGPTGSVAGLVQAGSGAHTIAPGGIGGIGTLTLTGGLITAGGLTTINFDLGAGPATNIGGLNVITNGDLIDSPNFTVIDDSNGGTALTFGTATSGSPIPSGYYRLFTDPSMDISGDSETNYGFSLPTPPAGDTFSLTAADTGYIDLDVVGPVITSQHLFWDNAGGTGDGMTWDINTNQNFNNGSSASVYHEGDYVTFNDTNNGNYNVTLNTFVHPTSVTVTTAMAYAITGTGGIGDVTGGTTPLLVTGTGSLTLGGSNTFTGGTTVGTGSDTAKLILSGKTAYPVATPLTIMSGATVQIAAHAGNASNVVVVQTSTLSNSGLVDLTNNDLTEKAATNLLGTVTAQVKAGFQGGTWQGSTGITSTLAASNSSHLTAVGVIQNDMSVNGGSTAAIYGSGTTLGLFDGTNPALDDILVKYTYYGDTNLDGAVDGSDYTNIDNGFTHHLSGWQNGDFNYDGVVDGSDYTLIDNAFNTQGTSLGSNPAALVASATSQIAGGSSVPEPTTLGLLGVGAAGLLARRRRRNA